MTNRYLWVVEFFLDGEWWAHADSVFDTRAGADHGCTGLMAESPSSMAFLH